VQGTLALARHTGHADMVFADDVRATLAHMGVPVRVSRGFGGGMCRVGWVGKHCGLSAHAQPSMGVSTASSTPVELAPGQALPLLVPRDVQLETDWLAADGKQVPSASRAIAKRARVAGAARGERRTVISLPDRVVPFPQEYADVLLVVEQVVQTRDTSRASADRRAAVFAFASTDGAVQDVASMLVRTAVSAHRSTIPVVVLCGCDLAAALALNPAVDDAPFVCERERCGEMWRMGWIGLVK